MGGNSVAESVELAAILLTDLVGSTRLATSVGPVRADQLREEHFDLLRDAIASSAGKEVKNTGDGLMIAFFSTSEAVRCAVAMQQLFERRYRAAEQSLHIRIGLGAGESTVKDGDYFGMPSIEAARLCDQAPSDGILISAAVKMLAGRCEGVEFASAGEFELKGFPDPVQAFAVSWAPLAEEAWAASRWPLPALLRLVPVVAYVGRTEERAALDEALNLARAHQRQAVLLSGEPGIGKTRLASYAAHHAQSEGFAALWGACSEELAVPYEPWIEICTHVVEHAPDELLQRHVERHKGELARLARNLERRIPDLPAPQSSDPETERYLLFSAVTGLLADVAEAVPLCVVLDDLHWADAQSLALLKHLLRALEQGSLQVIATFRDSELGKDHPLTNVLADLRRLDGVQRIALHGLGAGDVAEIMTAVAGHELEADGLELAAQIAAETDGNPFFVGEVLHGLSESGALLFDEATGRWRIDNFAGIALPASVREVIERRVERLGEESLEPLRLAAVIGREFDLDLLSSVVGTDETRLLDHLEAAVTASLLAESSDRLGRFRFAHALINQTLYDGLGATRRARMHQRVAQALEDLYGDDPGEHLGELALHWRRATVSVESAKAAGYALRAGQQALENLAPAEALKLFTDAVELTGEEDTREGCEARIGLGEAQRLTGNAAYRETLLEASRIASGLEDAELAAEAALANSRGIASALGGVDEQRLAAIARAIELDEPPHPARRARLLALQAIELAWDRSSEFAVRGALAQEAISLARGGDVRTLAQVLHLAFFACWSAETLRLRSEIAKELSDAAAASGDPALHVWAREVEWQVLAEMGEFARAQAALEGGKRVADEIGEPALRWVVETNVAAWELLRGDFVAGERCVEEAFQLGQEAGETDAVLFYGAQLSFLRVFQGRGNETVEMLRQSVSAAPGIAAFRAGLAALLCWLGSDDEARAILDQEVNDRFEHILPEPAELSALVLYADAAALLQHRQAASLLYQRIQPRADQVVVVSTHGYGHVRLWLGLLAAVLDRGDEARDHLSFACEFHEANDLPLWAARAHLGWAEAPGLRGDLAGALKHAARALELSRKHGYGAIERRAAALVESESRAGI
ncbi:MAG: serine/threonine protein kinase [Solirubrobacterales bacterium]|jgi:class 3 adenylate cyclase|nr:serine/threonine protein kinase [Solirubrobacterales bacterium]